MNKNISKGIGSVAGLIGILLAMYFMHGNSAVTGFKNIKLGADYHTIKQLQLCDLSPLFMANGDEHAVCDDYQTFGTSSRLILDFKNKKLSNINIVFFKYKFWPQAFPYLSKTYGKPDKEISDEDYDAVDNGDSTSQLNVSFGSSKQVTYSVYKYKGDAIEALNISHD